MPFEILYSGIDGKKNCEEEEDQVAFRSRTSFYLQTSGEESTRSTRSCGRDAVINKPYQPLGSMQSVLNLRIRKTTAENHQEDSTKRGKGVAELNKKNSQTKDSEEESAGQSSQQRKFWVGNQECDTEGRGEGKRTLATELWKIRQLHNKKGEGISVSGYKEIQSSLRVGNDRIKCVKAGGSFYYEFRKNDPLESAKWASKMAARKLARTAKDQARYDGEKNSDSSPRSEDSPTPPPLEDSSKLTLSRKPSVPLKPRRPSENSAGRRVSTRSTKTSQNIAEVSKVSSGSTTERLRDEFDAILSKGKEEKNIIEEESEKKAQGHGSRINTRRRGEDRKRWRDQQRLSHGVAPDLSTDSAELDFSELMQRGSQLTREGTFRQGIRLKLLQEKQKRMTNATKSVASDRNAILREQAKIAKPIGEETKKKLPSYILHFSRKLNTSAQQAQAQVQAHVQAQAQALVLRRNNLPAVEGGDGLKIAEIASGSEGEYEPGEKEHKAILEKIQQAAVTSKLLEKSLLKRSEEFCMSQKRLGDELSDKIEGVDFDRGNEYRRKFVALDVVLNRHMYKTLLDSGKKSSHVKQFDHAKQLTVMRTTARELGAVQRQYNLANSLWFQTLTNKVMDMSPKLTHPEHKLLAALRQLIIEGWVLSPDLFKKVLLDILEPNDHKMPPVQRMISLIRDNVLKMDLNNYLEFLRENKLHVPKSLLDKLAEPQRGGSLLVGMRAAALAMKWKRRTILGNNPQ